MGIIKNIFVSTLFSLNLCLGIDAIIGFRINADTRVNRRQQVHVELFLFLTRICWAIKLSLVIKNGHILFYL